MDGKKEKDELDSIVLTGTLEIELEEINHEKEQSQEELKVVLEAKEDELVMLEPEDKPKMEKPSLCYQHVCRSEQNCCWMSRLAAEGLGKKSLLQIIIPGSHDSATCNISMKQKYSPDAPPALLKCPKVLSSALKRITVDWAVAQERTILQQLEDGIRYLDLRVCFVPNKEGNEEIGTLYTCHSVISDNVTDVLDQIQMFTSIHPEEILILDFNHFYKLTEEAHHVLCNMLLSRFASIMIPGDFNLNDPIQNIWNEKQNIIVLYKTKKLHEFLPFPFLWWQNKSTIHSAWMNTPDPKILETKLCTHLEERKAIIDGRKEAGKYDYANIFHVTQGIVTPNGSTIANGSTWKINSSSLKGIGKKTTKKLISWCTTKWVDLNLNIIIADVYDTTNFVDALVQMNADRLEVLDEES